ARWVHLSIIRPRSSAQYALSNDRHIPRCIRARSATPMHVGETRATTTSSAAAATGSQIRAVQDPVFHFYLQNNGMSPVPPSSPLPRPLKLTLVPGGTPMLGPENTSGYFTLGSSITLNDDAGAVYLNVNNSVSTSYQPLTLDAAPTTEDWGLEGDTIILTDPRQLNFLACATNDPAFYDVYMQQGDDTPDGATCTLITLHLPCLC
ncbi:hypothetical protein BD626DRAFT_591077, partial [Schizophyllum amplum]